MPDPIPSRNTGPVPVPPPSLGDLTAPPAANGSRLSVYAAVLDTLETAAPSGPWVPDAQAAFRDEPIAEKPRDLDPATRARLDRWVGGIFTRGPANARVAPPRVLVAPVPVFDPATAGTVGDGSLVPPDGRALAGAPAPGRGAVPPPGLDRGNTIIRYAPNGDPVNFPILAQGATNGCGSTSLAMMLNFMAGGKGGFTRESVDAAIRHYDLFTSPGEIAAYARRRGLDAAISSGTSVGDLKRMIDQGLPVQVVLDISDAHDGSGLHYEVVTGYGMGPDGKPYFELVNPWGNREYMAEDAFLARWSDISAKGFPLGLNRVAIAVKPRGSGARLLPSEEGAWFDSGMTSLRVARGLTQVTSGWARQDGATTTAGAIRLLLGGLAAIPALLGHAGRLASTRYMQDGLAEMKRPDGFWRGLGQTVLGGAGAALSAIPEAAGNVLNRAVDLLADGSYQAVRRVGNWFRKELRGR